MIELGRQSISHSGSSQREIGGVTVNIPRDKMNELEEKSRELLDKAMEMDNSATSGSHPVVQLNIQLFTCTRD